jgi:uncharacterized protein
VVGLNVTILIVDGYNIIGSWDDLKKLKEKSMGSARDQLISTLSAYSPWAWERIIIVFDGQSFGWERVDGVEVVFTEGSESADTMIERLAAGLSARHRVEVATSDYAEHLAATGLGAVVLSAPALSERLAELRDSYKRRLADQPAGKGIMLNDILNKSILDNLERMRRL